MRKALFFVAPSDLYVNSENGTAAAFPYATPATATPSLHDALDAAIDGSVIHVAEGHYVLPETLDVEKGVRIIGAGMEATTLDIVENAPAQQARLLIVNHPSAVISNMKLTGGHYGIYSYSGKTGFGSGMKIGGQGGTITHCRITGNYAGNYYQRGGGIAVCGEKALLTHSIIDHNTNIFQSDTRECGGGIYVTAGRVENCLIWGNRSHNGGGICITGTGRVRNCTVTDNVAEYLAGGIYWEDGGTEVVNTLFINNQADQDGSRGAPEWRAKAENTAQFNKIASAFSHCAFTCATATEDSSILIQPPFISAETHDYHLVPGSEPINAGIVYDGISATDLDDQNRLSGNAPDIGCYELDSTIFRATFRATKTKFFADENCQLTANLENAPAGAEFDYEWLFTDHLGKTFILSGTSIDQTIPAGRYTIKLTVTDVSDPSVKASLSRKDYLLVAPRAFHVLAAAENPTMGYPYDSWETATTNVFDLAGLVIEGSKILFSKGTHVITNSLRIDQPITLQGQGIGQSTIQLSPKAPADRVIYVNHEKAVIDALTITGGRLREKFGYGVGVWIGARGGTVSRSRITGNTSFHYYQKGGGVGLTSVKSHLTHCIIDNNSVIYYEIAQFSGGVYASAGIVDNCLVYSNTAPLGAGIVAEETGLFRNCTVVHNQSVLTPRAPKGGHGGGVYLKKGGTIENTIFAGNTSIDGDTTRGAPEWFADSGLKTKDATRIVRCAWPADLPANALISADSIHCDPLFKNPEHLDFRLRADSPCRNTGHYEGDWATTDLAGKPRIFGKKIDIGAYECDIRQSLIIMLR